MLSYYFHFEPSPHEGNFHFHLSCCLVKPHFKNPIKHCYWKVLSMKGSTYITLRAQLFYEHCVLWTLWSPSLKVWIQNAPKSTCSITNEHSTSDSTCRRENSCIRPDTVSLHFCNPNTPGAETGRLEVQDQPGPLRKILFKRVVF